MDKLSSLIGRLEKFESDIPVIIKEIIESNSHVITEMNTEKQLYEKGVNSQGVSIESYRPYRARTLEIKQSKGQPADRVTLRDTGSFHHSFIIEANTDSFLIKAMDNKTLELMIKYGDEILGLTDENTQTLSHEIIKPELLTKLKQVANGN